MPLPRSVMFLKIHFLKGLQDMSLNFLHKDREAIRTPMVHNAILSAISGFITEQRISAIDCDVYFHR